MKYFSCLLALLVAGIFPPEVLAAETFGTASSVQAPSINGTVKGNVRVMTGQGFSINSGAVIDGDLLVPGTPNVQANGTPNWQGTRDGTGSTSPSGYTIYVNQGSKLGQVVRRTNPITLATVPRPPSPAGSRSLWLNAGQSPGNFATIRSLGLNSNYGNLNVPAGTYGDLTVNSGTTMTLGVAGGTQPVVYNVERITINSSGNFQIAGPVILNVAYGANVNGPGALGNVAHPEWLVVNIHSGGVYVNSNQGKVFGAVNAPSSDVNINGQVKGAVAANRLTVNSGGILDLPLPGGGGGPVNQLPTVSITTPANGTSVVQAQPLIITAQAADSDGTITSVKFLINGVIAGTDTAAPFQLEHTFATVGAQSIVAQATDNAGATTNSGAVVVQVVAANRPPVASAIECTLPEDGNGSFTLIGSDPDGNALSFVVVTGPAHGTLAGTAPNLTYTPAPNYFGTDTFTFRANDGSIESAPATVTIAVTPVNDAPTAAAVDVTTTEDTPVALQLAGSDLDGDPLTYEITQQPAHGVLSGTAPNLTYTSEANYFGTDTFVYRLKDGVANSGLATVTISISNSNDAPVATSANATTAEDVSLPLILTGSDPNEG